MNVIKIVLKAGEKLSSVCKNCCFVVPSAMFDDAGFCKPCNMCFIDDITKDRPLWCPLVVEEVCEWVLEKTDRGYAAFYIPKDHEQHQDCFTQNADTFKYCPSCGKRIKYVEVE
jgi:hypothetical protein